MGQSSTSRAVSQEYYNTNGSYPISSIGQDPKAGAGDRIKGAKRVDAASTQLSAKEVGAL